MKFIAPAMNGKMWHHPATQRNLLQLKNDGATVIDPAEGELACGYQGIGRLAEVEEILKAIARREASKLSESAGVSLPKIARA